MQLVWNGIWKGTITIPTGMEYVSFVGSENSNGKLSQLNKVYFAIESEVKDVNFEYLSMNSDGGFMFQVGRRSSTILLLKAVK